MGIQLMLDDFGTGYSSLSNLQLFPFDLVKIDCPFVDRRGVFQANMSMVAAMVQLAGSLDLTPIAEIIEGEAAASSLKAMGCRFGQGYYFSEPIEADAALKRLRSQVAFETAHASSDTMVVSPVQGDGSHTLIMRRLQDPSRRELATSETVIVRPLEEAGLREVIISTTRETARQERALSDTIKVRVIDEDTSSTAMLPIETIGFCAPPMMKMMTKRMSRSGQALGLSGGAVRVERMPDSSARNPATLSATFAGLLPAGVVAAELRTPGDPSLLEPEEALAVANAVPKRVQEFAAGRLCARRALAEFGVVDFPVRAARDRQPIWPEFLVGSITHTRGCAPRCSPRARASLRSAWIPK